MALVSGLIPMKVTYLGDVRGPVIGSRFFCSLKYDVAYQFVKSSGLDRHRFSNDSSRPFDRCLLLSVVLLVHLIDFFS